MTLDSANSNQNVSDDVFHVVQESIPSVPNNDIPQAKVSTMANAGNVNFEEQELPFVQVSSEEEKDLRIVVLDKQAEQKLVVDNVTAVPLLEDDCANNLVNSKSKVKNVIHPQCDTMCSVEKVPKQSSVVKNCTSKYKFVKSNKPKPIPQVYVKAFETNPSPLKLYAFKAWLNGYDPILKAQLLQNIQHGVSIPCLRPTNAQTSVPKNQPSALKNSKLVDEFIQEELRNNRICGPFETRPEGLFVSPLAAVPKKDSDKPRIIHNLSFPRGDSINDFIPRAFCAVEYETIDRCVELIHKLGPSTLISKADVKTAFRCLRISKQDLKFLGFTWFEKFYFDLMLPMGLSTSCSAFELLSTAVQWILQQKLNVQHVTHILDDYMFFWEGRYQRLWGFPVMFYVFSGEYRTSH